jgi:hypothetical protein
MAEPRIDHDELDWKLERLRRLAEEMYEGTCSLDDSTFRRLLYTNEQGTDYCGRLYARMHSIIDDFWKFRLALLWDSLPQRRPDALRFCREKYELVSQALTEGFTKERTSDPYAALLATGFERLGQASVLLNHPKQVTTSQFAEAVYALAAAYALFFLSQDQDEWTMLTTFYQDLYRTFNPEAKERKRT